jgi:pantoate--beta-alanine ligase
LPVVIKTEKDIREFVADYKLKGKSIGFVPTMGALHLGHLSLIDRCAAENDCCIVSIFVNPTQFTDSEDFEKYPRIPHKDIEILSNTKCDVVFLPSTLEIYPEKQIHLLKLNLGVLGDTLEGKFRPEHFDGVVTILNRFFKMINPNKTYFGKKDYQQLLVVKRLVNELHPDIQVIPCDTVREEDGLAMSSRNSLLSGKERELAPVIYQVLRKAKDLLAEKPVSFVRKWVETTLKTYSLISFEYFEIAHQETLIPVEEIRKNPKVVLLTAVKIGKIRLIDNLET